ncbi:MAG: alpha/beta fold hydrolase [Clostridia bacterium]|nr:alpha/beta fold hydrolase [Clostridia bacterium]
MREELYIPASMGKMFGIFQKPSDSSPLIILSHGFNGSHMGNQDFADFFSSHGFSTFCLDFCGGGTNSLSDGNTMDMSVLTEAEDLNCVLNYFKPHYSTIFLWGASMGGFISSYVAAHRPQDVKALAIEFPAYVLQDDAKKRANPDGTFPETVDAMRTVIGRKFNMDAVSFDIYEVISAYTGDVLIQHGDHDGIVPLSYSQRAEKIFPSAELVVLPGQGHGFRDEGRAEAMERELAFFQQRSPKTQE